MNDYIRPGRQLAYDGAALALAAAIGKAREIGAPENVSIVDAGGNLLAFGRMDGARFLAQHSSLAKARTAASLAMPTGQMPVQFGLDLALATGGQSTNLPGGLPIIFEGDLLGAVGIGSGTAEQDLMVAEAARDAVLDALGN